MDLKSFQSQVGAWSRQNFGDQGAHRPLLGLVEECAELVDALDLMSVQQSSTARDLIADSGADFMIFLADYCERAGYDLSKVYHMPKRPEDADTKFLLKHLGKLSRAQLKTEQNIRGGRERFTPIAEKAMSQLILQMTMLLEEHDIDLLTAVEHTWETTVSKRDWQANPEDGG